MFEKRGVRGGVLVLAILFVMGLFALQPAMATAEGEHHEHEGSHSDHGGSLHTVVEFAQIVLSLGAIGAVGLTARVYGGEIGRALYVSGAGVAVFALERLWHNLAATLGVGLPELGTTASNGLYLLATALLAAGYLLLYRTMSVRT